MAITVVALSLVACAEVDDTIGSHLTQPPAGAPKPKPVEAGDIAIVGQEVAHAIMDLPAISAASVPPLVRFTGVTSIVDKPIDTEPYTELLRDRILLLTREKMRFVEHTLPPYIPPSKKKVKAAPQPVQNTTEADYEILAELRGFVKDDFYKIQVEFVDVHSSEVLFNQVYRIHKEASEEPQPPSADHAAAAPDANVPSPSAPSGSAALL